MVDSVPPEYAKYSWRVSDADPSAYARHGMGVDRLLHLFKDRMFLGVDLSFANPLSRGDLLVAARKAWITLRFQEPVVASSMNTTVDDDLLMVYHLVTDPSTLEAWAERTVELTEASTLADARTKIDQRRPETPDAHNDQTFLHIVPRGSDKEYTIVLYGTHVPYDGAGYQAIMTRYLRHLARYAFDRTLVEKEHAALRWGEEAKNLPPPYFEVVAKSEPLNGPVFNQALASSLQAFGVVAATHPWKDRDALEGQEIRSRAEHYFSEEETSRLIRYAKARSFNINHMLHAALGLASLVENPSVAEGAVFPAMVTYNARERLRSPYDERLRYTGVATTVSVVNVPVSKLDGVEDPQMRLDILADAMGVEYAKIRTSPALLGICSQNAEVMFSSLKTSGPQMWSKLLPRLVADGVGERNLDPDYANAEGSHIFGITDFFLCPRGLGSMTFFRAHTWRGRLKLSCDYDAALIPVEDMEGIMRMVVDLVLAHA